MTLDNCTLTSTSTTSSAIENGWYYPSQNTEGTNCVLVIEGGTYTCGYYAVKNDDYGILTINGGTFISTAGTSAAVLLNWNVATINDGTFEAQASNCYAIYNGSATSGSDAYTTYEAGDLTINGGTYIYETTYAITGTNRAEYATINGGTFSGNNLVRYSDRGAVSDGYSLVENSDGTYTVTASE